MKDSGWRKPKRSFANANCAEVAGMGGTVLVRDSKDARHGTVLRFTARGWERFTRAIKE